MWVHHRTRLSRFQESAYLRLRDELMISELVRIHGVTNSVYGVRKIHAAMRRAGWKVGHHQVVCSMRRAGLRGVIRGHKPVTTTPATKTAGQFPDLVQRASPPMPRIGYRSQTSRSCDPDPGLRTWRSSPTRSAAKSSAGTSPTGSPPSRCPYKNSRWSRGQRGGTSRDTGHF